MLADVSIGPPPVSWELAPAGRLPVFTSALITNSTNDSPTHATRATTRYLRTRQTVIGRRVRPSPRFHAGQRRLGGQFHRRLP